MTHNQKQMINTNRAVIVNFDGTANSYVANPLSGAVASPATTRSAVAYTNIYIPFPVKEIHVRGIDLIGMSIVLPCTLHLHSPIIFL